MKNQNGFGSIICLDKTGKKRRKPYAVRITTGWKDGKQVRKYLGYYTSQADALIALAEYHKNGLDIDLSKLTIKEVYERFMKRLENENATRAVTAKHKMVYDRLGRLGNKPMKDIKTDHLQDWFDEIELMPGTKKKISGSLKEVYNYALTNDIVMKNYAAPIKLREKIEKSGKVFTSEEVQWLWDNKHLEMAKHLLILIYTGMRIGELLDTTLDLSHLSSDFIIGGNKTENGKNRIIPIHREIKPLILELLEKSKYIIHKSDGGSITYNSFKLRFQQFIAKLGWEHKIHDTRKTGVSIMHSSGIPMEVVRIIVGHSGKGVTEQVYLYKEPSELVEWINKIKV